MILAYFFKPDCLRILVQRARCQIVARFARNGDSAGLTGMLELSMATPGCHQIPAILVGAVVQVYSKDAVEVEFVTASGRTQALVTLATSSIRPVSPKDIPAVRQLEAA